MTKFGATGGFPRGKFSQDDEGELRLRIGVKDRTLIIDFGTPVTWVGLDYHSAKEFAQTILKRAEEIAPKKGAA